MNLVSLHGNVVISGAAAAASRLDWGAWSDHTLFPRPVWTTRAGLVTHPVVSGARWQRAIVHVTDHRLQPWVVGTILGQIQVMPDSTICQQRQVAVRCWDRTGHVVHVE